MTKKELKEIVKKSCRDEFERIVDWDIETEPMYNEYLVRVITVSKHHTVFRKNYWIREDGLINWEDTHTEVLN